MEKNLFNVHSCASCGSKLCVEKVNLFNHLSRNDLHDVLSIIKHKNYKKGEIIFNPGETFDTLYVINGGQIKIHNFSYEGNENILYILNEGEYFGEIKLLNETSFKHYGTAIKNTKICMIHKKDFDKLLKEKPSISLKILKSASKKIKSLEAHLQILQSSSAKERIIGFILNEYYKNDKTEFTIKMTQKEIANYLGIRRETYSRQFNKLIDDGLINRTNEGFVIKKINKLMKWSPISFDF